MRGEIAVLRLVRHPNRELVDFFEDATHIRIVTPLKRGGELYARIAGRPRFSERDARGVWAAASRKRVLPAPARHCAS